MNSCWLQPRTTWLNRTIQLPTVPKSTGRSRDTLRSQTAARATLRGLHSSVTLVCWKCYHGDLLCWGGGALVTVADVAGEGRGGDWGLVSYLFTTRLRVLWEPFTRQIASCLKPLRGISLILTSSSPTWRLTDAALLPSSTWNINTTDGKLRIEHNLLQGHQKYFKEANSCCQVC